jgi:hypothetical protein
MPAKSLFLQIRVSRSEKAQLRRLAKDAGMDLSAYVLARALPAPRVHFLQLVRSLVDGHARHHVLAELNDFLTSLPGTQYGDAVSRVDLHLLSRLDANYVAAMIEHAAYLKAIPAPDWTRSVEPLDRPWFASELPSLRPHLLRAAPVAFKRRNIYVDSSIGDRV